MDSDADQRGKKIIKMVRRCLFKRCRVFCVGNKMATESQLDFVREIEAAVSAILMDRKPVGITITEIMEMAGRSIHQVNPIVTRIAQSGEMELLQRIQAAFAKAGIKQATTDRLLARNKGAEAPEVTALDEPETLKLDQVIPAPAAAQEKPVVVSINRPPVQSDRKALDKVLEILEPLPKASQAKLISSAAVYLGVAE